MRQVNLPLRKLSWESHGCWKGKGWWGPEGLFVWSVQAPWQHSHYESCLTAAVPTFSTSWKGDSRTHLLLREAKSLPSWPPCRNGQVTV